MVRWRRKVSRFVIDYERKKNKALNTFAEGEINVVKLRGVGKESTLNPQEKIIFALVLCVQSGQNELAKKVCGLIEVFLV